MKKLAIGCGVVVLLAVIVGAAGVYYVAHRVRSTVTSFAALGSIPDIERQVQDKNPYTPPDSGEFTGAQLDELLAVQAAVKQKLGDRFQVLDGKYKALSDSLKQRDATVMDAPALLGAYRDSAATYVDAVRWQVEALNAQHLSMAQYKWIRKQAYAAIGLTVMDFDIGEMIDDVKSGQTPPAQHVDVVVGPTGPESNQKLAEAHHKALEDNAALAFLGL